MRTLALVLASFAMLALPTAVAETELGSGHIVAGSPTTIAFGLADVTSLFFAAPEAGTNLTTRTVDNAGIGYDLDLYFYDAAGNYLGGCSTSAADEVCTVPAAAAEVEVAAFYGADLHVTLVAL